jgi:hypothetical protein
MARLGVAPHVADKMLNHQSGTISGVAAVYQRHDFLAERKEALERWSAHVINIIAKTSLGNRIDVRESRGDAPAGHIFRIFDHSPKIVAMRAATNDVCS